METTAATRRRPGRPKLADHLRSTRVRLTTTVAPETLVTLEEENAATGVSIGTLIDEAISMRKKKRK